MLLAINIGNSSIRFGVFEAESCRARWLIQSKPHKSADEYAVTIHSILRENEMDTRDIDHVIAASVVPALTGVIRAAVDELFGFEPEFINYHMKTGLTFPIENPKELGADLLANAAAAAATGRDTIVIDFGTALSFTVVRSSGELSGIVISPGVVSALGSLVEDTAQLPAIELKAPERVVGVETIGCIQSGLIHGYTGLFEHIVDRIDQEQGTESLVIATGGVAHVFEKVSSRIDCFDDLHTLKGLRILYELNKRE